MNVLHIVNNFGVGGLESVIRHLAMTTTDGLFPHVCVLSKAGRFSTKVSNAGIPLYHMDRNNKAKRNKACLCEIIGLIKNWEIEVLHCHDISSWFFGVISGQKSRKPIVMTKHGNLENWNIKTILLTKILSMLTNRIVAVSPETKKDLVKRQFVREKKIVVIFNGIDLGPFQNQISKRDARLRLGLPNECFVTGSITRFYPVKNIEAQIKMVTALKNEIPGLKHLIVAPIATDYGRQIQEYIERTGLGKSILLLGFRDDIPQILNAMDIFVLTSFSEGTSIALIEAIAAGLPAVVSNVGGNRYLVKDDVNGFLFDLNKESDFEKKVLEIYNNKEILDRFSNNQGAIAAKFSDKEMIQRYKLLYECLL